MIQLFTNMIHPIGIRMITLQQNQNDVGVIRFITFRIHGGMDNPNGVGA